ncbi:RhoGAP domain-containing protein [Entophlyctis helioformis]|nr:RhoGAP domain-containing protein [Entophlyctis helioformis]
MQPQHSTAKAAKFAASSSLPATTTTTSASPSAAMAGSAPAGTPPPASSSPSTPPSSDPFSDPTDDVSHHHSNHHQHHDTSPSLSPSASAGDLAGRGGAHGSAAAPSSPGAASNSNGQTTTTTSSGTSAKLSSFAKSFQKRTAAVAKVAAEGTAKFGSMAYEKGSEWGQKAKTAAVQASTTIAQKRREYEDHSAHQSPSGSANGLNSGGSQQQQQQQPAPLYPIFGASILDAVLRSKPGSNPYKDVPIIVYRCIEFLDANGLEEIGMYRLSGSITEVQSLRRLFNSGDDVDLAQLYPDPNAIASLFKSFFRELPENILTKELLPVFMAPFAKFTDDDATFPQHLTASDQHPITSDPATLAALSAAARRLPRQNYAVLAVLFAHLSRVSARHAVNKMGIGNLQVVWTPTLGFGSSLFAVFLAQHSRLFPMDASYYSATPASASASAPAFNTPPGSASSSPVFASGTVLPARGSSHGQSPPPPDTASEHSKIVIPPRSATSSGQASAGILGDTDLARSRPPSASASASASAYPPAQSNAPVQRTGARSPSPTKKPLPPIPPSSRLSTHFGKSRLSNGSLLDTADGDAGGDILASYMAAPAPAPVRAGAGASAAVASGQTEAYNPFDEIYGGVEGLTLLRGDAGPASAPVMPSGVGNQAGRLQASAAGEPLSSSSSTGEAAAPPKPPRGTRSANPDYSAGRQPDLAYDPPATTSGGIKIPPRNQSK